MRIHHHAGEVAVMWMTTRIMRNLPTVVVGDAQVTATGMTRPRGGSV
jgi:hypothetical protein